MKKDISSNINKTADHPLQSFEWGEFREKTNVKVVRENGFQLTIHKIPKTPWNIGYLPKGSFPTEKEISKLKEIGKREKCIFIQLEPNVRKDEIGNWKLEIGNSRLKRAARPLFTKYTFVLDLTKSEEELLRGMSQKTRYNIKVAQKHGVEIAEDNSDEAFEEYLRLTRETTKRQGFYAHTERYHKLMWQTLGIKNYESGIKAKKGNHNSYFMIHDSNKLSAHLFLAKYKPSTSDGRKAKSKVLVAWLLFIFKDTLYYPYGASSSEHRETMASNLMMWEAIKFGKGLGLKKFDMWGALGPNPDPKDPWYGFHKFKQGYGPELVEFIGSYDLVINPVLYELYKVTDKLRWLILRVKK